MSAFTTALADVQSLMMVATEEASRRRERSVDLDHLFLALVLSEQDAGRALRSLGVTLEGARAAVDEQHRAQLAALGVTLAAPDAGPITAHDGGGEFVWTDRALDTLKRAASYGRRGDPSTVLLELLAEPSGLIDAVLERLGTTGAAVRSRVSEMDRVPAQGARSFGPRTLSGRTEVFIPAAPDAIWDLLSTPARLPEWYGDHLDVSDPPAAGELGSSWIAVLQAEDPRGRPLRVRPELRRLRATITAFERPHAIEWIIDFVDAPRGNVRRIRMELALAAGGSQVTIHARWEPRSDAARRRVPGLRILLSPLHRFALWTQLSHLSRSLSRAFR